MLDSQRFRDERTDDDMGIGDERKGEEKAKEREERREGSLRDAEEFEGGRDESGQEGDAEPAEAEAGKGDAELGSCQEAVLVGYDVAGLGGEGDAFFDEGFELGATDANKGDFGGREKGVEEDESGDGAKLEEDKLGGVGGKRGFREEREKRVHWCGMSAQEEALVS